MNFRPDSWCVNCSNVSGTGTFNQVRRVPVVSDDGFCAGIIAQADVARTAPKREVADLLREVSQHHS